MYRLTERRLNKASEILDRYADQLKQSRHIESGLLERELRKEWGIGYQTLKSIMIDMLRNERYRLIAAYYMQHQNAPSPVSQFLPHLARLYGTGVYDPKDKDGKRAAFWAVALGSNPPD